MSGNRLDSSVNEQKSSGCLFQIKDHLEMILVAFIMALVIRCFFVEVFKIPTGSMEPTLMGNHEEMNTSGDRIMVNKFYYLFHPVRRYDVIVFRYPLNVMRNFIKRAVAIGPEYIRMEGGDIYHSKKPNGSFDIARKSFTKQQSIWIPIPADRSSNQGVDILDTWQFDGAGDVNRNPEFLQLQGGQEADQLMFGQKVTDAAVTASDSAYSGGFHQVTDVKITSTISQLSSSDSLIYSLYDPPYHFDFRVSGDGSAKIKVKNTSRSSKEVKSVPIGDIDLTQKSTIGFFIYDGQVGVTLEGERVASLEYRNSYRQLTRNESNDVPRPVVKAVDGSCHLHELNLYRDIYYHWGEGKRVNFQEKNEPIRIPENRILVIGDNVNSSRDSRKWKMNVITMPDGSKYYIDRRTWRRAVSGRRSHVTDRSGRRFSPADLSSRQQIEIRPMRFVRKELLVGKAIWVWWPYNRLKFIR